VRLIVRAEVAATDGGITSRGNGLASLIERCQLDNRQHKFYDLVYRGSRAAPAFGRARGVLDSARAHSL